MTENASCWSTTRSSARPRSGNCCGCCENVDGSKKFTCASPVHRSSRRATTGSICQRSLNSSLRTTWPTTSLRRKKNNTWPTSSVAGQSALPADRIGCQVHRIARENLCQACVDTVYPTIAGERLYADAVVNFKSGQRQLQPRLRRPGITSILTFPTGHLAVQSEPASRRQASRRLKRLHCGSTICSESGHRCALPQAVFCPLCSMTTSCRPSARTPTTGLQDGPTACASSFSVLDLRSPSFGQSDNHRNEFPEHRPQKRPTIRHRQTVPRLSLNVNNERSLHIP